MPVAAILGVLLIGLIAMSWLLNRDALRQAVEAQIRAVTGLDLVVNGPIEVSVFPGSYVSFHNVGLKGGGAIDAALTVDTLTANLRLLPLLMQRFEIADLMLLRPQINVVRDAKGESNWTPFIDTLARNMKPGGAPLSFSEIRIQDGVLAYRNAGNDAETIDDIDLSLAWPSISRSFAATGQFDWRDDRIEVRRAGSHHRLLRRDISTQHTLQSRAAVDTERRREGGKTRVTLNHQHALPTRRQHLTERQRHKRLALA